ncbi:hypothetical protein EDD21DRAFT_400309 [Dissophora ornata]|nr:hypothetical protein BGZ58_009525 [Dissophora ornata]KAI8606589.1 hypothetical protein EDD21DRAFT_400309 [Dissophora ornata]
MRSFAKAAALLAMTTLGLLAPTVHAQEQTDAFSKSGVVGGFKDTLNSLSSLTVGPYPSLASTGVSPVMPGGAKGLGILDKRQYSCDPGYGYCGNGYCCPTNELCFNTYGACCPKSLPWLCGGTYCCPYDSCLSDGHCGCNNNLYRCGNTCCKYGCNASGNCGCPSSYPVDCGDDSCCPAGTVCVSGGKCMASGGGGGNPAPAPVPSPTPAPVVPPIISPAPVVPPVITPAPTPSSGSGSGGGGIGIGIGGAGNTTSTTTSSTSMTNAPRSAGSIMQASGTATAVFAIAVALLMI